MLDETGLVIGIPLFGRRSLSLQAKDNKQIMLSIFKLRFSPFATYSLARLFGVWLATRLAEQFVEYCFPFRDSLYPFFKIYVLRYILLLPVLFVCTCKYIS